MKILDFFNFKKRSRERQERIEEEKLQQKRLEEEKLRQKKEFFIKKRTFIDKIVEEYNKIETKKRRDYEDYENNKIHEWNTTCQNCRSTNVIQVYNRHKGQIDGNLDGNSYHSSSHSFFSGSSYSSSSVKGRLHGELDTLTVIQCNVCGHVWERKKQLSIFNNDYYYKKIDYKRICKRLIIKLYDLLDELKNFNPNKLDETCSTLDEKKKQLLDNFKTSSVEGFDDIKDLPIIYGKPTAFYIKDNSLSFYPIPDKMYKIIIDYSTFALGKDTDKNTIFALREDTDTFEIPKKYEQLFLNALISKSMMYALASPTDENYAGYAIQYEKAYKLLIKAVGGRRKNRKIVF